MKTLLPKTPQPTARHRIQIEHSGEDVVFSPELKSLLEGSDKPKTNNGDRTGAQTDPNGNAIPFNQD